KAARVVETAQVAGGVAAAGAAQEPPVAPPAPSATAAAPAAAWAPAEEPETAAPAPEMPVAPAAPQSQPETETVPGAALAPEESIADDDFATGVPKSGSLKLVWVGLGCGALLAAGFFAFEWWNSRAEDQRARPPELDAPAESVASASAGVPPSAAAEPTAEAVASAPAAESVPAPSASAAEAAGDDGDDGSQLNWGQGYLIVESSADADVFATGFKVGRTNSKNQSSCGLKFVRLGEGEPPSWLTPGQTVDVKCRAITRVKLEPKP
ncbi:MAG TPA: hypothetical protein PKA88_28450, partial [Polyangiaceae bacterium]|nr:hypothetical protein [Polyangiaceae bacterium]